MTVDLATWGKSFYQGIQAGSHVEAVREVNMLADPILRELGAVLVGCAFWKESSQQSVLLYKQVKSVFTVRYLQHIIGDDAIPILFKNQTIYLISIKYKKFKSDGGRSFSTRGCSDSV